jgi:hypothetical protein
MQNPFFRFLEWLWVWLRERPWQIRWGVVVVLVVMIVRVVLPPSLFQSFSCELRNLPQSYRSSNGYFIDNQVVVVARRDQVTDVIGTPTPVVSVTPGTPPTTTTLLVVGTPTVTGTPAAPGTPATPETPVVTATPVGPEKVILNLIEDCDLSYLNSRKATDNSKVKENEFVMRLYEIPNGSTVVDVLSQIEAKAEGKEIFADPNYLTRLADVTSDPCALPDDAGGSGGKPFGGPGALNFTSYDPGLAKEAFERQWALRQINLPAVSTFTGNGVRVGVFDTSPYRISFPFIKRVAEALPSPLWFPNWDAGGTTMASSHGLFVAELIHAMVPNSNIQLIRVLYEDGCGDMWTLNKGLEDYKSRMSAWTGKLDKTVINMSLGIRLPKELEEDDDTGAEQDKPGEPEQDTGPEDEPGDTTPEVNGEKYEVTETLAALFNEELETLETLINDAYDMGAIIVASAGNDSTRKLDTMDRVVENIAPIQVPAKFDNVIGAVATNPDGIRACYSNKGEAGDVAAPGGEGGVDPQDSKDLCASRASSWYEMPDPCSHTDMANCQYGLTSLVQTRYRPQYMIWSGTSFSAPLISGMAALLYEDLRQKDVMCVMLGGPSTPTPTDLGHGLIDVANSLRPTAIQPCLTP